MKRSLDFQAEKMIRERRRHGHIRRVIALLSAFVLLFTMNSLKMSADTLERIPMCGLEEHKHTLSCYPLICVEAEAEPQYDLKRAYVGSVAPHWHTEDCFNDDGVLACGYVDGIYYHVHNRWCYDDDNNLVCGLKEYKPHVHTAECYQEVPELICGMDEYPSHVHTEDCYFTIHELACGLEEGPGHIHTSDCYHAHTELTCGKAENNGHVHTDECFYPVTEVTCGQIEGPGHVHTSECYTHELVCGQLESEAHQHTDACYADVLSCGIPQGAGAHTHNESCYTTYNILVCGKKEGEGAHKHTPECYTTYNNLICYIEEGEGAHRHTDACYIDYRYLVCGQEESEGHTHTDECYAYTQELICNEPDASQLAAEQLVMEDVKVHTHTDACFTTVIRNVDGEDRELRFATCGYFEIPTLKCTESDWMSYPVLVSEGHRHTSACYDLTADPICGLQEHVHTDACYQQRPVKPASEDGDANGTVENEEVPQETEIELGENTTDAQVKAPEQESANDGASDGIENKTAVDNDENETDNQKQTEVDNAEKPADTKVEATEENKEDEEAGKKSEETDETEANEAKSDEDSEKKSDESDETEADEAKADEDAEKKSDGTDETEADEAKSDEDSGKKSDETEADEAKADEDSEKKSDETEADEAKADEDAEKKSDGTDETEADEAKSDEDSGKKSDESDETEADEAKAGEDAEKKSDETDETEADETKADGEEGKDADTEDEEGVDGEEGEQSDEEGEGADGEEGEAEGEEPVYTAGERVIDVYQGSVTLSWGPEAEIPEDVRIEVFEIEKGTEAYDILYNNAMAALQRTKDTETTTQVMRFFDITLYVGEEEFEPKAPISVTVKVKEARETNDDADVDAIHMEEVGASAEVVEATTEGDTVSFEAESFSVYGVSVDVPPETVQEDVGVKVDLSNVDLLEGAEVGRESVTLSISELLQTQDNGDVIVDGGMSIDHDEFLKTAEVTSSGEGVQVEGDSIVLPADALENGVVSLEVTTYETENYVTTETTRKVEIELTGYQGRADEAEGDNVTVTALGDNSLPADAKPILTEGADVPADIVAEDAENEAAAAFEITVKNGNGDGREISNTGAVKVTVTPENLNVLEGLPEGTDLENVKYELYHIHDDGTVDPPVTLSKDDIVVDEEGNVEKFSFETDSFSTYILKYTVELEYIEGKGVINLDFTGFDALSAEDGEGIVYDTADCNVHVTADQLGAMLRGAEEGDCAVSVDADIAEEFAFDIDKAELVSAEGGVGFAEGELTIEGDGSVELTDGSGNLIVNITGITALKEELLEAEGVSIEVVKGAIPLGSEASYTAHTDEETQALVDAYDAYLNGAKDGQEGDEASGQAPVAGYTSADLKITRNGEDLAAEGEFRVTVEKQSLVPAGMKLEKLYHIHDGAVDELDVKETENGIEFTMTGFSDIVASYSVDFEYNGYRWSFPGLGSYSIADIMAQIGVEGEIEKVELDLVKAVDETAEEALYLEEKEDGWYLNSDVAFDDTYELKVTVDGSECVITVTDDSFDYSVRLDFKDGSTVLSDAGLYESYYLVVSSNGSNNRYYAPISTDGTLGAFRNSSHVEIGNKVPQLSGAGNYYIIRNTSDQPNLEPADNLRIKNGGTLEVYGLSFPDAVTGDTYVFTATKQNVYVVLFQYRDSEGNLIAPEGLNNFNNLKLYAAVNDGFYTRYWLDGVDQAIKTDSSTLRTISSFSLASADPKTKPYASTDNVMVYVGYENFGVNNQTGTLERENNAIKGYVLTDGSVFGEYKVSITKQPNATIYTCTPIQPHTVSVQFENGDMGLANGQHYYVYATQKKGGKVYGKTQQLTFDRQHHASVSFTTLTNYSNSKTYTIAADENTNYYLVKGSFATDGALDAAIVKYGDGDSEVVNGAGRTFSVTTAGDTTTITRAGSAAYSYVVKVANHSGTAKLAKPDLNGQTWYVYAAITRNGETYSNVAPVSEASFLGNVVGEEQTYVQPTGSFTVFYNEKDAKAASNVTESTVRTAGYVDGDSVTLALLRPAGAVTNTEAQPMWKYFADKSNINTNALYGSEVETIYTLETTSSGANGELKLVEGPGASIHFVAEDVSRLFVNGGKYFVYAKLSIPDGTKKRTGYYVKALTNASNQNWTVEIPNGVFKVKHESDAEHYKNYTLAGNRVFEVGLVKANSSSATETTVLKDILDNEPAVENGTNPASNPNKPYTMYAGGTTAEGYLLTAVDGTPSKTTAKLTLSLLDRLSLVGEVKQGDSSVAYDSTSDYHALVELVQDGVSSYALVKLNNITALNAAQTIEYFERERTVSGNTIVEKRYYEAGNTLKYYIVKAARGTSLTWQKALAGTDCVRFAPGQNTGEYAAEFTLNDGLITATLNKQSVPTGDSHTVVINMYDYDQQKLSAPVTPALDSNAHHYLLAWLTSKDPDTLGQVVGWQIVPINVGTTGTQGSLNATGTWSHTLTASSFFLCDAAMNKIPDGVDTQNNPTYAMVGYDSGLYNLNLRLYRDIGYQQGTVDSFTAMRTGSTVTDDPPTSYDFMDADKSDPNETIIRLHTSYTKNYQLKLKIVQNDDDGISFADGDDYYIMVKLIHNDSDQGTFAFAKLVASSDGPNTTSETTLQLINTSGNVWSLWGSSPSKGMTHFTGNEKGIEFQIVRSTGYGLQEYTKGLYGIFTPVGGSVKMYTLSRGEREQSDDKDGKVTTITDTLILTEDSEGIRKGEIDRMLALATEFGLYTEILSKHATDMESNIGADHVTGPIGADYGFSTNNTLVNRIKVVKRYLNQDGTAYNGSVVLGLFKEDGETLVEETDALALVNGVAEYTFSMLPAGSYIVKEKLGNEWYGFEDVADPIQVNNQEVTVNFSDGVITLRDINSNINYFGTIDDNNVNLTDLLRHSRNGIVVTDTPEGKQALDDANSGLATVYQAGTAAYPKTYDIPADMAKLCAFSAKLGNSTSSKNVRVINMKPSDIPDNGIVINATDDKRYVVLNIDLTGYGSTANIFTRVWYNGEMLDPDFGKHGREDSSKVLFNFITRDSQGNAHPYTGHINTTSEGAGILLAPAAVVGDLGGNWGGTIICHEAQHSGSEIHSDNPNKILNVNTMLTNSIGKPETGDLELQKDVVGEVQDYTTWFTFRVTMTKSDGTAVNGEFVASGIQQGNTVTFDNGVATFDVRANNKVHISGLPKDATFTVEEVFTNNSEHYQLVSIVDVDNEPFTYGTIASGKTVYVRAVNAHKVGGLTVTKAVVGDPTGSKTFNFKVTILKQDPVDSDEADPDFNGTYGGMKFENGVALFELGSGEYKSASAKGITTGRRFKVEELSADKENFETSVQVTSLGATQTVGKVVYGTIQEGESPAVIVTYTNRHVDGGAYSPKVTKKLKSGGVEAQDWPEGVSFAFTLSTVDGNPATGFEMPTDTSATATATDRTACFGMIKFTAPGTYKFKIQETNGGAAGVTYETRPLYLDVLVNEDNEDPSNPVYKVVKVKYYYLSGTDQVDEDGDDAQEITTGIANAAGVIVNEYEDNTGSLKITKTVKVNGEPIPEDAADAFKVLADGTYTFRVYKENGTELATKANGTAIGDLTITVENGVMVGEGVLVSGLAEGTYVVKEIETSSTNAAAQMVTQDVTGYVAEKGGIVVEVTANNETNVPTAAFTNNVETTQATVIKVWDDGNNAMGIRPASLTVTLYADGTSTGKTVTLDDSNSWSATLTNLPKYDYTKAVGAQEIAYTWQEAVVDGYLLSGEPVITNDDQGNATITTLTNRPDATSISVEKVWSDGNQNHTGDTVKVKLYKVYGQPVNSSDIVTLTVSAAGGSMPTDSDSAITITIDGVEYTLNKDNGWQQSVGNIVRGSQGQHTVEVTGVAGDIASAAPGTAQVDGSGNVTVPVTATLATTDVNIRVTLTGTDSKATGVTAHINGSDISLSGSGNVYSGTVTGLTRGQTYPISFTGTASDGYSVSVTGGDVAVGHAATQDYETSGTVTLATKNISYSISLPSGNWYYSDGTTSYTMPTSGYIPVGIWGNAENDNVLSGSLSYDSTSGAWTTLSGNIVVPETAGSERTYSIWIGDNDDRKYHTSGNATAGSVSLASGSANFNASASSVNVALKVSVDEEAPATNAKYVRVNWTGAAPEGLTFQVKSYNPGNNWQGAIIGTLSASNNWRLPLTVNAESNDSENIQIIASGGSQVYYDNGTKNTSYNNTNDVVFNACALSTTDFVTLNANVGSWLNHDGTSGASAPTDSVNINVVAKYTVNNNDLVSKSVSLNSGNGWSNSITDLPRYFAGTTTPVPYVVEYYSDKADVVESVTATSPTPGGDGKVNFSNGTTPVSVTLQGTKAVEKQTKTVTMTVEWEGIFSVNTGINGFDNSEQYEYNKAKEQLAHTGWTVSDGNATSQKILTLTYSQEWNEYVINVGAIQANNGYVVQCEQAKRTQTANGATYFVFDWNTSAFTIKGVRQSGAIPTSYQMASASPLDFLFPAAYADENNASGKTIALPGTDYLPSNRVAVDGTEVTLNSGDIGWTYTWSNLPKTELVTVGETQVEEYVYYYVVETWSSNPNVTTTAYRIDSMHDDDADTTENEALRINKVEVTNTVGKGALKIHKTWNGVPTGTDVGALGFAITGPNNYINAVTYSQFSNDEYTIENLDPGTYTVAEANATNLIADYRLVVSESTTSDSADVAVGAVVTVNLTNKYEEEKGSVKVTKTFAGDITASQVPAGFQITATWDNQTRVLEISGMQSYSDVAVSGSFPNYTWTISELPLHQTVTFVESGYDLAGYNVTVTGSANAATATATAEMTPGEASFTNTYDELPGSLKIQKNVTVNGAAIGSSSTASDKALVSGTYTFTVASTTLNPQVSKTVAITFVDGIATSVTGDNAVLSNGVVTVSNLPADTYTVTESTPTNGTSLTGDNGVSVIVSKGDTQPIQTATFTNNIDTGDLSLTKTVTGKANDDTAFSFDIQLTAPAGVTLAGSYAATHTGDGSVNSVTVGNITTNDAGRSTGTITGITLKHNDVITITGLPAGTDYTITEADYTAQGYKKGAVANLSGTIPANGDSHRVRTIAASVVNVFEAEGEKTFNVKKIFTNGDLSQKRFTFKLTQVDAENSTTPVTTKLSEPETVTTTLTTGTEQIINFQSVAHFTQDDVGKTFWFMIEEVVPEGAQTDPYIDGHVRYANPFRKWVSVSVSLSGQQLVITKSTPADQPADAVFTNEQLGKLIVTKTFAGNATLTPEQKAAITFSISGPTGFTPIANLSLGNTTSEPRFELDNNTGIYTLTLDNIPLGEYTVTEDVASANIGNYRRVTTISVDGGTAEQNHTQTVLLSASDVDSAVNVTNTYDNYQLEITKSFTGAALTDAQKNAITFTVSGGDLKEGGTDKGTLVKTWADIDAMENDKWILTTAANNIQPGVEYTVTESNMDFGGYTRVTTYKVNGATDPTTGDAAQVTIIGDSLVGTVAFTNDYTSHIPYTPVADKVLNKGQTLAPDSLWPDDGFSFRLTAVGGTDATGAAIAQNLVPLPDDQHRRSFVKYVTVDNDGTSTRQKVVDPVFGEITFTAPGTYNYQITENTPEGAVNGILNGITYNTKPVALQVVVEKNEQTGALYISSVKYGDDEAATTTEAIAAAKATVVNTIEVKDFEFNKKWFTDFTAESLTGWPEDIVSIQVTIGRRLKYEAADPETGNVTPYYKVENGFGMDYTLTKDSATGEVTGLPTMTVTESNNVYTYSLSGLDKYGSLADSGNEDRQGEWEYFVSESSEGLSAYMAPRYVKYGETEVSPVTRESTDDRGTIENHKITVSLPATGGTGTTAIYAAGAGLLLLALLGFIWLNRKRDDGAGI